MPILVLLIAFLACQPASTDVYLPALPALGDTFGASPAQIQLTLSVFIAGFASAQLIAGPLSDRFGRRPVVLLGAGLLTLSLLGGAMAPTLGWLVALRFVQSVGVCCLVVSARAIVRDLYAPAEGTRVMARAMGWMAVVPLVGPVLTSLLLEVTSWRGLFTLLGLFAAGLLVLAWRDLPESNRQLNPHALSARQLIGNYLFIARHGEFWAYALIGAATYGALFSFISGSPYVVMDVLGQPRWVFGVVFGVATAGFIVGTLILRRVMPVIGLRRLLIIAATASALSGLLMLAITLTGHQSLAGLLVPMLGVMIAHGIINAAAQVATIGPFPTRAGAAAALNGFQMHAFGALVGLWIGVSFDGTMLPMAATIAALTCLLALFAYTLVRRFAPRNP